MSGFAPPKRYPPREEVEPEPYELDPAGNYVYHLDPAGQYVIVLDSCYNRVRVKVDGRLRPYLDVVQYALGLFQDGKSSFIMMPRVGDGEIKVYKVNNWRQRAQLEESSLANSEDTGSVKEEPAEV